MKVTFTKEMKEVITVAQVTAVKKVIDYMKEDTGIKEYAEMATRIVTGWNDNEILEVKAEIAGNARVWDRYDEGTENIDVWLNIKAFKECEGFYRIGVYLSDIWEITGENNEEIKEHMYIEEYKLTK